MRVTQNALFNQLRQQLFDGTGRLMHAQEQMATQKRINRLSDNPVDGGRVLDLKSAVTRSKQYIEAIGRADSTAGIYDTALDQMQGLVVRAKELAIQESNEVTSTTATREATRIELSILTSEMVHVANTQFDGRYVFSGFQTKQPAFADATAVAASGGGNTGGATAAVSIVNTTQLNYHAFAVRFTAADRYEVVDTTTGATVLADQAYASGDAIRFQGLEMTVTNGAGAPATGDEFAVSVIPPGVFQGDGQSQEVEIQPGTRVTVNVTGDRVFQGNGVPGGVDLFSIMNAINGALREGDTDALQAQLDTLDKAREQLSNERANVGTRTNLLEQVKARQLDIQDNLEVLRSNLEDIDIAEAATELTKRQNAYEATLAAASRIVQPSLLDFLR